MAEIISANSLQTFHYCWPGSSPTSSSWLRLFNLRGPWDSKHINILEDSSGQEWTYTDMKNLESVCQTAFLCDCPGIYTVLKLQSIKFLWWLPALPFSLLILCYDEVRKFIMRKLPPGNWVERETYY